MSYLNKRGVSTIIQSTLIMALSVVAIFAVWGYVKDLSGDLSKQLSPTVDCIQQQSKVLNSCVNEEGKILVNLNVGLDEEIARVEFRLKDESFLCGTNSCSSCSISEVQGKKTIYLNPTAQASNQDLLVSSINGCNFEQIIISSCI